MHGINADFDHDTVGVISRPARTAEQPREMLAISGMRRLPLYRGLLDPFAGQDLRW